MFVIIFIRTVKYRGQEGTLSQPYLYLSRRGYFTINQHRVLSVWKKIRGL